MPKKPKKPVAAKAPPRSVRAGPNPARQAAFLAAYALCGANVTAAAREAKIDPSTHYDWLKRDKTYPERLEAARQAACDAIEAEIFRRGQVGYDEPVVYQGKIAKDKRGRLVTVRRFSDVLLIFRAKALMPEKYGDRTKLEHSTPDNTPLEVVFNQGWYGNDAHQKQEQAKRDQRPSSA